MSASRPFPAGDVDSEEDEDFNPEAEVASDDGGRGTNADNDEAKSEQIKSEGGSTPRDMPPAIEQDEEPKEEEEEEEEGAEATSSLRRQSRESGGDEEEDDRDRENGERIDEEGDDAEGDEEDEDQRDEDEVDEEEDDDDEEEEEVQGHRRKRHKRDRRNQFLDVEAEVEDEDEEVDEEDDEMPGEGFLADTHPDDDLPPGDEMDDRRHRELDRRRQEEENMDAEQQASRFKEKYGRNRAAAVDVAVVPQRLLLPSVDDPTIWGVKCKPGKEKETLFAIQKRIEDRLFGSAPIGITAAFERGGTMAGYIYVEARRQSDVMTAVEGLPNAYPYSKMTLVPISEMPDLLRTRKSKPLEPGMYVRIKRPPLYQGDLAQIEEVEANGTEVECRLIPRLDYGVNEDMNAPVSSTVTATKAGKRKRQVTQVKRPPARLFSDVEARKKNGRFLQQLSSYTEKEFSYSGQIYKNGFLLKSFRLNQLQTEDVNPTLEEVTRFTNSGEEGTDNVDLSALAQTLKASNENANYLPGDSVEIYSGEQRGVCGKAISVQGDIVTLKVTEGELMGQTIDAPIKGLRKRFSEGDHVKIMGGSKYQDELGMVVRIKDDRVTIVSDSNNQEITVFSKDLRAATDTAVLTSGSKYDLYDLVQLDPSTVACVIKVDRESLKVLDQTGYVRTLLPSNITNKLERRRFAVSTDKDGTEIRNDDTVKEVSGEQRQGRVMHIHRSYLFIQNRQQTENAGIFVSRSSSVVTVAAKGGRVTNAGPDLTKMNPALQKNGSNGNAAAMPPPKAVGGKDRLIGKTVNIRKGPYKGLMGIVKDASAVEARVELHSKTKVVSVSKDMLVVKDPYTGASIDASRFGGRGGYSGSSGGRSFPGSTSRVPDAAWDGGRTPAAAVANGGKTPAWSAGAQGSRTPAWKAQPAGARTPAPGWADGSRTAYGGGTSYGGSTWNAGSSTPFHPSAGSRTPAAWDAGSHATPHHRPGFYDAPTPGGELRDHPTPRGANPYGPGFGGGIGSTAAADTPGPYGTTTGRTPGASNARTPGAWGAGIDDEDDGYM